MLHGIVPSGVKLVGAAAGNIAQIGSGPGGDSACCYYISYFVLRLEILVLVCLAVQGESEVLLKRI